MIDKNIEKTPFNFNHFAAVMLGGLCGFLVAAPLALSTNTPAIGALALIAGLAAGGLVGYRRRNSRGFLYLCFVIILVLSGTLSSALSPR
jgi:hypothetical protein